MAEYLQTQIMYRNLLLDREHNEIRTLELHSSNSDDTELSGSLIRMSLDDIQTPFTALSYVWGPSTKGESIRVAENCHLGITDNLASALRVLRNQGHQHRIWIDAICINQNDTEERNHQVQMMRKIYSLASMVLTWIPCDLQPTSPAIQRLQSLTTLSTEEDLGMSGAWLPLLLLFRDSYWSRAWIQQEVAFATKWELQSHNLRLSDSVMHFVRIWSKQFGEGQARQGLAAGQWMLLSPPQPLLRKSITPRSSPATSNQDEAALRGQGLLKSLANARALKSTDDRDRLYATMFLAGNVHDGDILADYTLSLLHTFMKVPAYLMDRHACLDFLTYAGIPYSETDEATEFPTWLPRWTEDSNIGGPSSALSQCRHSSAFPEHLAPHIEPENRSLHAYAVKLTTISKAWDLGNFPSSSLNNIMYSTVNQFRWQCAGMAKYSIAQRAKTIQDGESENSSSEPSEFAQKEFVSAMLRLCGAHCFMEYACQIEKLKHGQQGVTKYAQDIANSFDAIFAKETFIGKDMNQAFTTGNLRDQSTIENPMLAGIFPCTGDQNDHVGCTFIRNMVTNRNWGNHIPFVGERGEIGMMPLRAREGDEVWAIVGCSAVMLLRRGQDGGLSLVGEGYLEGHNFGEVQAEVMDDAQVGDKVRDSIIEKIVLR